MKKFALVLFLVIAITGSVLGDTNVTLTQSNIPYTIEGGGQNDFENGWTNIYLSGNLTIGSGSAITISSYNDDVDSVRIYLGDDTLFFGTTQANNNTAIRITSSANGNGRASHIQIIGGAIVHRPPSGSEVVDGASGNECITISGADNVLIDNVNMVVRGGPSFCINPTMDTRYDNAYNSNVEIKLCSLWNYSTWFNSRCDNECAAIKVGIDYRAEGPYGYNQFTAGEYNYYIHHNAVLATPHTGILVYGTSIVDSNYCIGDARNDKYNYYSGGLCNSADNPYMIGIESYPGCEGSRCVGNVIRSGNNYEGSRGIILSGVLGTADDPYECAYNDVRVHNGPSDYYSNGGQVFGIRARYDNNYAHIHDNYVEVIVDNDPATSSIGRGAYAIFFSAGVRSSDADSHNRIYRNRCVALADTTKSYVDGQSNLYGLALENNLAHGATDNASYGNYIISNGTPFKLGETNLGAAQWTSHEDTMVWVHPNYDDEYSHKGVVGVGFSDYDCSNNIICDPVFVNSDQDDVALTSAAGGTIKEITWQRTLRVTVLGSNGLRVPGAQVTVRNAYNRTVLSGYTVNGRLEGVVAYDWDYWTGNEGTEQDSAYNNFTITVQKGSDIATQTVTISATSGQPTLTLQNTVGEQDTTPPSRITDLASSTGLEVGSIYLSWTAPGDDAGSGASAAYVIKYGKNPINDANWASQTGVMLNPPDPADAGTAESAVLTGLDEGELYYVGIKAVDDGGNESLLSNVSSAEAGTDIATGEEDEFVSSTLVPDDGERVRSRFPILSAQNISVPGENYYYFEVASDSNFVELVAASDPVPESFTNFTEWQVPVQLDLNEEYYWRVRVNEFAYSSAAGFLVLASQPFPNPVRFREGDVVTFELPTTPINLLIQTVAGETVLIARDISGTWQWDGLNASGNRVASGIYLWSIEGSGEHGKLMVKP